MTPDGNECELLDAFVDSYVRWRAACDDVWSTYWAWVECNSGDGAVPFAAYRSALDREETTAVIHHEQARRLSAFALERLRNGQAGAR
jgi:hypothetical protein